MYFKNSSTMGYRTRPIAAKWSSANAKPLSFIPICDPIMSASESSANRTILDSCSLRAVPLIVIWASDDIMGYGYCDEADFTSTSGLSLLSLYHISKGVSL
jgi:hypothetical protein